MLPPAESYGLAIEPDFGAGAFYAVPDLGEATGLGCRGEQLEVLPERQVVAVRVARERNSLEVDDDPAPGALGDVSGVAGKTVREVDQSVGVARQLDAFLDPQRRAGVAALAERRARSAERPGDDEAVARPGAGAAGHALRAPDGGDGDQDRGRFGRVPATHRNTALRDPAVELEHVVELGRCWDTQADEQRLRPSAGSGEIADVDGGRSEAELPPRQPVEPEVHALDERVLCDDKPVAELSRVVVDLFGEAAALKLGQQAELAELRQSHARVLCEPRQRSLPPGRR